MKDRCLEQDALKRLRAAISPTTDPMVILGVQEGIRLADDLIESTILLNNLIGKDLRGHLRRAGVMFRIRDLCNRGDLPFHADTTRMPIGGWHWLEIRAPGIRAHICRTDYAEAFPDDTPNKQDARLVNPQGDLFRDKVIPLSDVISSVEEMYSWLTYGAMRNGNLTHLCWAVPASDSNVWLARENILRSAAGSNDIPPPPPPPQTPDPKTKLRFRRHIEQALEKKKDDDRQA
jgi:hypothetical protein